MSGQDSPAQELCYDVPRLLQLFESLGENCDFGVIQRAVGLEPFGLFRFAFCSAAGLTALLRTRFQPLGEPEDLWLDVVGPRREYWVKSRQFPIEAHTDRFADQDDPEVARTAQIERTRFLKTHLVRDLARARRIFVFRGAAADLAIIQDIAAQLQTYGPNCLLWVSIGDRARIPGSVERISSHLLHGFLSRFGTHDGSGPRPPVEEWVSVCSNAYRLWRGADPPKAPLDNLISRASATGSCQWFGDTPATHALDEPLLAPGVMLEHRIGKGGLASVYTAHLPITSGGPFAFSVWIRIPMEFRGRQIEALLPGFSSLAGWTADLKSRDRWQRLWVTATLPADARIISCEIVAQGRVGAVFHSAFWCLERGNRPSGLGFALGERGALVAPSVGL